MKRPSPPAPRAERNDALVVELLARNADLLRQLHGERRASTSGVSGFLQVMIGQHLTLARLLRAQINSSKLDDSMPRP